MENDALTIPPRELAEICERYGVQRLWLFGSHARGNASGASDVDILVEFVAGQQPGLRFLRLEEELSGILGRRVDLNTAGFLSRYFRDDVIAQARQIYGTR